MALSGAGLAGNKNWLLLWSICGGSILIGLRAILAVCCDQWRQTGRLCQRVAVYGSGAAARHVMQQLAAGRAAAMDHVMVGVYGDTADPANTQRQVHVLCGDLDMLLAEIRRQWVDAVIVAPALVEGQSGTIIERLRQAAVDIYVYPDMPGIGTGTTAAAEIGGVPLLPVERRPLRDWRGIAKAAEDRVFAAVALLLISPLLALIAVLIKLDSPGPVLFRQKRYGLNNQLIEVLKFRTMRQDMCDQTASQLTRRNDPRVTRIGRFLRRTSLDELPQFINVLFGEMSVVGPRPHATAAKAAGLLYQDAVPNYDCRHRMKPGITGLAQVSGWRGETETVEQIRKRVEHDIRYIETWSLLLDAKIILRTMLGGFTGRQAF
jgi:Undecaprenyl-phosphate glucose phosphotransferase